ncbi:YnbE family lipoprotein [Desulfonema ishimotonii]|uniref:YnbE family lipoprotein n=1 Tax=Desulfonema ishimotonii TaxID=45657 RepID=A0A401G2J6_9BACT|nr:hypothetical protein [Desulfonema ishimotonii]GBC63391.1 YnbE family lipoprotein [Desulfonema ishimotonii]
MSKKLMCVSALLFVLSAAACTQHHVQVEPIRTEHVVEVKPMEMTINVNVNVRVDEALDDFFGDIDQAEPAAASE